MSSQAKDVVITGSVGFLVLSAIGCAGIFLEGSPLSIQILGAIVLVAAGVMAGITFMVVLVDRREEGGR